MTMDKMASKIGITNRHPNARATTLSPYSSASRRITPAETRVYIGDASAMPAAWPLFEVSDIDVLLVPTSTFANPAKLRVSIPRRIFSTRSRFQRHPRFSVRHSPYGIPATPIP